MNNFRIFTDSSCDLPAELATELELTVINLSLVAEGKTYVNYLDGREIGFHEYYEMLRNGLQAKTTAANVDSFEGPFEEALKEGDDVLYLGFSSGLSGTYNAGRLVAEELSAKYPDRKIYAVDTLCASLGQGLLVYLAANLKKEGKTIEEIRDWVEANKHSMSHLFTVDDLHHLHRGGRVSKTTAIVGSVLGMKPLMHADENGCLSKTGVARGRKASIEALFKRMKETAIDPENQVIFISHGDCIDDANYLADKIRSELKVKDIVINFIGPVIGTHSGPGTLALFFLASER
ncbi:MAG: DegV family protein [Clostridia bacterium]|nr:DegV family protein [Clostridia bacterium]MBQ2387341.1 DegV family protein [Clostridia bacterium]MBQ2420069.1 DegV family protein [Clostridia bacterium]MBQ5597301.1 DegV family protein [Clostridia bacterium]MBQ5902662.1 DegV family protein [Clostridia bacterium]